MKKYTYIPSSFVVAWIIWELIVRLGGFNEALFPTPYRVLLGFGEFINDGVLIKDIVDSLVRFFIGYIISVVSGVLLGLVLGWYKGIWNYINPIVQVIRLFLLLRGYRSLYCYSASAKHQRLSSSLLLRFSLYYCPLYRPFKISIPYILRWRAILALNNQRCYLKLYYQRYFLALLPVCISPLVQRGYSSLQGKWLAPKQGLDSSLSI